MSTTLGKIFVPDEGPDDADILLVGEAPGADEEIERRPFIGTSGNLLRVCLRRAGADFDRIRFANLCHYRPSGNRFETILDSRELKEGIRDLIAYIKRARPKVIGALGNWPTYYLTGKRGIRNYRGSILPWLVDPTIKVVCCLHPAFISRDNSQYPIFDLDIRRIIKEKDIEGFNYPQYKIKHDPSGIELEQITDYLCNAYRLAVDIETVKKTGKILCIGFAPNQHEAYVFVLDTTHKRQCVQRILQSRARKTFHFGFFDTSVLADNGLFVENYDWDTIVGAHVLQPELPRTLAFLTSIYTRQIYYKDSGRANIPKSEDSEGDSDGKSWSDKFDRRLLYDYNGTDCCTTSAVQLEQELELNEDPENRATFDFEMSMVPIANRISRMGFQIDEERRAWLRETLERKWGKAQFILDNLTGFETNVQSPKLRTILYDKLELPVKRNRDGNPTADEDAIISLITHCTQRLNELKTEAARSDWKVRLAVCKLVLQIRGTRKTLSTYVNFRASDDGCMRSLYREDGTETGRWSAGKYVDGSGVAAQTLPREAIDVPDDVINIKPVKEDESESEESVPSEEGETISSA